MNSENEDDHQSNIELQLEDLIGKLPDWAAYVKELMHQVSCLESKPPLSQWYYLLIHFLMLTRVLAQFPS